MREKYKHEKSSLPFTVRLYKKLKNHIQILFISVNIPFDLMLLLHPSHNYICRQRLHVPGYFRKRIYFSCLQKVRVHTKCVRIVFARPQENAKMTEIQ